MGASEEKKPLLDASGRDVEPEDSTATAILRRKKKDNGMYYNISFSRHFIKWSINQF